MSTRPQQKPRNAAKKVVKKDQSHNNNSDFHYRAPDSKSVAPKKERSKSHVVSYGGSSSSTDMGVPNEAPVTPPAPPTAVSRLLSYSPAINTIQEQERLNALGISARLVRSELAKHPHPISAAIRKTLTARAMHAALSDSIAYRMDEHSLLSIYSSPRDQAIVDVVNKGAVEPIRLYNYRPIITSKDITRYVPNMNQWAGEPVRGAFMVDVYSAGRLRAQNGHPLNYENGPLTPTRMVNIFHDIRFTAENLPSSPIIWVGHSFHGPAGTMEGEGGWIRETDQGRDWIHCRPDSEPTTSPYSRHDPLDWLWTNTTFDDPITNAHLVWNLKATVGSFVMVEFRLIPNRVLTEDLLPPPSQFVEIQLQVREPEPEPFFPCLYPPRPASWVRCLITRDLQHKLELTPSFGAQTVMCLRLTEEKTVDLIRNDPQLQLQMRLFPDHWHGLISVLTLWTTASHARTNAHLVPQFLAENQDSVNTLNHFHSRWGVTFEEERVEPPSCAPFVFAGLALGLLFLSFFIYLFDGFGSLAALISTIFFALSAPAAAACYYAPYPAQVPGVGSFHTRMLIQVFDRLAPVYSLFFWPWITQNKFIYFKIPESFQFYYATLQTVIICPVLEELLKHAHPIFAFLFPLMESAGHARRHHHYGNFCILENCLIHWIFAMCPLEIAIVLHCFYNCLVVYEELLDIRLVSYFVPSYRPRDHFFQRWPRTRAGLFTCLSDLWKILSFVLSFIFFKCLRPLRSSCPHYDAFRTHFYESPWNQRRVFLDVPRLVEVFPPAKAQLPNALTAFVAKKPVRCQKLVKTGHLLVLADRVKPTQTHWFLPTCVPWQRPEPTNANLKHVAKHRLMVAALGNAATQTLWISIIVMLALFCPRFAPIVYGRVSPSWFTHFTGRKLKKYIADLQSYEKCGRLLLEKKSRSVKVMVKTDEALFRVTDGFLEMKPRGISVVASIVQLRVGPFVSEAQDRLKNTWSKTGWEVPTSRLNPPTAFLDTESIHRPRRVLTSMRLYYACGWSDLDLSDWMRLILRNRHQTHILVSGDDGLIYNSLTESFDECDLTMCDQSQDVGFALFERAFNIRLGIPADEADIIKKTTEVPFILEGKGPVPNHIRIDRSHRSERATGGPNTTNGNSIYNAVGHALIYGGYVADYALLGMTVKLKKNLGLHDVTFLKGMWYPTDRGPFWGPLPSRFLKMPKCWRSPLELYPRRTYAEASLQFLADLAHSFSFTLQIPLVRAFVQQFAHQRVQERYDVLDPWQTVRFADTRKPLITEEVWLHLNLRYGLTDADFLEMESMIPATPFHFLSHPGFLRLAMVDYA